MKARTFMTHRTTVERNVPASDQGGGYSDAWSQIANDVPCHAWSVNAQEVVTSDRPEVVNTRLVLVPKTADVRTGDRLATITDRKGTVLFTGPLLVDGVSEKPDHVQLMTRKIV